MHADAVPCAGNDASTGLVAEVEAAGRGAKGGVSWFISASGPSPPSVASRPLGGSPPPPGSPRPSRAPGRRGRRCAGVRASVRALVRTSASRRAPRDTEAERGQGADRHDPRDPRISGPR